MKRLPTAPRERLDLDLEEMSSDTDDDVSIANLLFLHIYTCFLLSVLLTNNSIFMQFSIRINPRNHPAILIDVDSLGGPDAKLTPVDPAAATQPLVQSQSARNFISFFCVHLISFITL